MKKMLCGVAIALALSGCKAPSVHPQEKLETSVVDGTALVHRHEIDAPKQFTPVYQAYRALYAASVMSTPGFQGKRLRTLGNGELYQVLGRVENNWLAISDNRELQLTGYVEFKAGVPSARYDATATGAPSASLPRSRQCIGVGNGDSACRKGRSATWIIQ